MKNLKVNIVSDTVLDYLSPFLNQASSGRIECQVAPYNQVAQTLLSEPEADSENLFLWTSPDIQCPKYSNLLAFEEIGLQAIIEEVSQFSNLIKNASKKYNSIFMMSWIFPPEKRWPLSLATKSCKGATDVLNRMNIHLSENLKGTNNFHLIDQTTLVYNFNKPIHDPRLYALARIRYSLDYIKFVAVNVKPLITATIDPSIKIIICDLDNTLWGGTVGDDGVDGLKIGGNDPTGEAHLLVQKELIALNNRGILLAISSKNESDIAIHAIKNHPNMLLRECNFAAKRINWDDKAKNILSLLKELNLLPSSAVFIDDNPTERQRIRDALPDIIVPEMPQDVSEWATIINSLPCLETLSQSQEDLNRSKNYQLETKRVEAQKLFGNLDDWLASLNLAIKVSGLSKANLQRTTQLLNKTNQFNLRTRRLSEEELYEWSRNDQRKCLTFSVSDRYGDSGLTSFVSIEKKDTQWEIIDFVMSCRIMGKGVEYAILSEIIKQKKGSEKLHMETIATKKNLPMRNFIKEVTKDQMVLDTIICPSHISIGRDVV